MKKSVVFLTLALTFAVPVVPSADAALTYRQGEGWSSDSDDAGKAAGTPSGQLALAEDLQKKGELGKALSAYQTLVRTWPNTAAARKAQLKIGDLNIAIGRFERAFDAYGKYLSNYPEGDEFETAVEAQFRIANSFLQGERRRIFGVKTFASMSKAEEMFKEILKNAPYSKFAPLAQFNIGRAYEKQGKTKEAVEAYQEVVTKYANDDIAADAMYQIGYIYLEDAKKGSNDPAAIQKAREAFEDFLLSYPQSEKVSQAQENLKLLEGKDIKKTLDIGKFYEKTGKPKAAVIYYDQVLQFGPGTPEAEEARKRIDDLKGRLGEDALRAGPERAETGLRAKESRKLQSQVDTASRPDFVGPPAPKAAPVPDEVAPEGPRLRSPRGTVEPNLPTQPSGAESDALTNP